MEFVELVGCVLLSGIIIAIGSCFKGGSGDGKGRGGSGGGDGDGGGE